MCSVLNRRLYNSCTADDIYLVSVFPEAESSFSLTSDTSDSEASSSPFLI